MKVTSPKASDSIRPLSQRSSVVIAQARQSGALSSQAANVSCGIRFYPTVACNCTGVRFYWMTTGGAKTIKVSLWDDVSARLTSTTIAVNATGTYEAFFATPVALTQGTIYRVTMWDAAGTAYTKATLSAFNAAGPTRPAVCGGGTWVLYSSTAWATGDVWPTSVATTECYPVEPLLDV